MSQIFVHNCRICNRKTTNVDGVCVSCLDMLDNGFWPYNITNKVKSVYDFSKEYIVSEVDKDAPRIVDWVFDYEAAKLCKDYINRVL